MASYDKVNNPLLDDADRAALDRVHRLTARSNAVRHVREAILKPWMRSFAAWFATVGNALTRKEQLIKCRQFAKDRVRINTMMTLLKRPDFAALVERYTEHTVEGLRAQLEDIAPDAIEANRKAIEWAVAKEDYKAIPTVTEPILSRVVPKKDDSPARPPVLIVNLGTGFAKQYAEAEIKECEVIELPIPEEDTP